MVSINTNLHLIMIHDMILASFTVVNDVFEAGGTFRNICEILKF